MKHLDGERAERASAQASEERCDRQRAKRESTEVSSVATTERTKVWIKLDRFAGFFVSSPRA